MKHSLYVALLAALFLLVPTAQAQQWNNPATGSMKLNGQDGPPFPITGVSLPTGTSAHISIDGYAHAGFTTFGSHQLATVGYPTLGGLLDVDLSGRVYVVFDGLMNPLYSTGPTGNYSVSLPVPTNATVGASRAWQTIIQNPATASGVTFTAATQGLVTQGPTTIPLNLPNNGGVALSLAPYGLTFPFYRDSYTLMYVNADGNITFGAPDGDFTPTPNEFRSGRPRIAPQWSDLDPTLGGYVNAVIDPSASIPTVTVNWVNVPEWQNSGSLHTFSAILESTTGLITLWHSPFNNAMIYDELMGIGPGLGREPAGIGYKDLSTLQNFPVTGVQDESFWEWFGLTGGSMPFYTQTFNNPWDMTGTTTYFIPTLPGAVGCYYIGY